MKLIIMLDMLLISYLIIYVLYLYLLIFSSIILKYPDSPEKRIKNKFAIIIPAHNEELYIERLIESIIEQNYEKELFTIFVVADNCTDKTVEIVSRYGIKVFIRNDKKKIGKGYALLHAIENINLDLFEAFLIVDADSFLKEDVLTNLNTIINSGGYIIQCYNGVANPGTSWFTRVMDVARSIGNEIIEPGKQKLGLTSYLMGNGMCFHAKILKKYGWNAFSIGEDWEYYSKLISNGERIHFAQKAHVLHQESINIKDATSQRIRWASGRFAIVFKYGIPIFLKGLMERNIKKIDASMILLLPNPSLGINLTIFALILTLLLKIQDYIGIVFPVIIIGIMILQILLFVFGAFKTENKMVNLLSLFFSPIFLIWKMCIDIVAFFGFRRKKWIRATRR